MRIHKQWLHELRRTILSVTLLWVIFFLPALSGCAYLKSHTPPPLSTQDKIQATQIDQDVTEGDMTSLEGNLEKDSLVHNIPI